MAGINSEEIFSGDEIDVDHIFSFVRARHDINFPVVVDTERTAVRGEWHRGYDTLRLSSDFLPQSCSIRRKEWQYPPVSHSSLFIYSA